MSPQGWAWTYRDHPWCLQGLAAQVDQMEEADREAQEARAAHAAWMAIIGQIYAACGASPDTGEGRAEPARERTGR